MELYINDFPMGTPSPAPATGLRAREEGVTVGGPSDIPSEKH